MGWNPISPADIPVDPEVIAAVNELLHQELDRFGFDRAEIRPAAFFDGMPYIRIDAFYRPVNEPFDTKILANCASTLAWRVRDLGEMRIASLEHHIRDDAPVLGIDDGSAS